MNADVRITFGAHAVLSQFSPLPGGEAQYPVEYIEHHRVLKLRENDEEVYIGIAAEPDEELLERLRRFHRKRIVYFTIEPGELSAYLGKQASGVGEGPDAAGTGTTGRGDGGNEQLLLDRIANDAPNVNLVNTILLDGIRAGASDIHIEPHEGRTRVRYRVDGELATHATYDRNRFTAISSRIKVMAELNVLERRLPQDGRLSVRFRDDTVELRVSIVPVKEGESIVLRIFNQHGYELRLEELGFEADTRKIIERLVSRTSGLVVLSGPTGSGKTTTLYAMVRRLAAENVKIVTIEDPVENLIAGSDQIQINEAIGLTFDSILRRVLRQDPNIIMVGETRDSATAALAVRAALTGHLVLTTVHTNDAISIATRFINLGVEPYLIASVLRGGVAQRLVRKLCTECATEREATAAERAIGERAGVRLDRVADPAGCGACNDTGFRGRIAVGEAFEVDREAADILAAGGSESAIRAHYAGMQTVLRNGCERVARGETTLRELEKAVSLS